MAKDFNAPNVAENYDQHILQLIPGYQLIHQLISAQLGYYLPKSAEILVVGCGTGYELEYLTRQFPHWRLTALEPSAAMLEKARQRCKNNALIDWVHGDLTAIQPNLKFDAALSVLVSHFIPYHEKLDFFKRIQSCLNKKGVLITVDLTQANHPHDFRILQQVCEQTGLTQVQSEKMYQRIQQDFHLLSESELQTILHTVGFERISTFWQMLQYQGLIAFAKS